MSRRELSIRRVSVRSQDCYEVAEGWSAKMIERITAFMAFWVVSWSHYSVLYQHLSKDDVISIISLSTRWVVFDVSHQTTKRTETTEVNEIWQLTCPSTQSDTLESRRSSWKKKENYLNVNAVRSRSLLEGSIQLGGRVLDANLAQIVTIHIKIYRTNKKRQSCFLFLTFR